MKQIISVFLFITALIISLIASASDMSDMSVNIKLQVEVRERLTDITNIGNFKKLYENEEWDIYGYVVDFKDNRQGPRNLYVYVPKASEKKIKIRLHGFLHFPFSHMTYKEFRRLMNNPVPLDEITSIFAQTESESFKRRFLNSLILDFALDDDFVRFFEKEKEHFYAFQEKYSDQLDKISIWNKEILKGVSNMATIKVTPDILAGNAEFKNYIDHIGDIGIDGVLPYITDSKCQRCFMMISNYSPSDNFSGYFWIEDENLLPEWNPNAVYFRLPLGKGWYVFRST